MLRRLKADVLTDMVPKKEMLVYCPLTQLQKNLYTYTIEKNIAKLRGIDDSSEPEVSPNSNSFFHILISCNYPVATEKILM